MITGTVVIEVAKHLLHATSKPSMKGTPNNPATISLVFHTGAGLNKESHGRKDCLCLTGDQTNKQEESMSTSVLPSSGGNDNWTTSTFSLKTDCKFSSANRSQTSVMGRKPLTSFHCFDVLALKHFEQ